MWLVNGIIHKHFKHEREYNTPWKLTVAPMRITEHTTH